ncbi:uncharacterized membrane protein YhaH (DUF805 family) [Flavobacterium cutihirudinis]|uniref:Uncharacterized membrane protein YhaH (DUF805 family) n=1 Tax=Flavobacterium cutihirudinis TaxID=1265740 RepID=A0A3D9FVH9_9FLAO|nr:DUF805 domain-containing protein [Flavobacterium cutihirudinis]RED24774.1 uncharacterized membrane protein YhaH (DUF805 family) [Flavobacterium cutihirudinis]
MIEWYKKVVFENYANFNGRARRSEYWFFTLMQCIILVSFIVLGAIIGSFFDSALGGLLVGYFAFAVYSFATLLPTLAVVVRRLHDVGKSGWFYFIAFIPFIGGIWLLVLMCTEGDFGPNDYGTDPKNEVEEINEIGKVELQ